MPRKKRNMGNKCCKESEGPQQKYVKGRDGERAQHPEQGRGNDKGMPVGAQQPGKESHMQYQQWQERNHAASPSNIQIEMKQQAPLKGEANHNQTNDARLKYELKRMEKKLRDSENDGMEMASKLKQQAQEIEKLKQKKRPANDVSKQNKQLQQLNDNIAEADAKCVQLQRENKDLKRELSKSEEDRKELMIRLSSAIGARLTDNNPDIADLSDMKRPTKLAEEFSELYDNLWTDAFDVLSEDNKKRSEKEACAVLLQVLVRTYEVCRRRAKSELDEMEKAASKFFKEGLPTEIIKQMKDRRKKQYTMRLPEIQAELVQPMNDLLKDSKEMKTRAVQIYLAKCTDICWSMSVQDPPLWMDTDIGQDGQKFNGQHYRAYTNSGNYCDYIVWPVIALCEGGGVLCKGVAQGRAYADNTVRAKTMDERSSSGSRMAPKEKDAAKPLTDLTQTGTEIADGSSSGEASTRSIPYSGSEMAKHSSSGTSTSDGSKKDKDGKSISIQSGQRISKTKSKTQTAQNGSFPPVKSSSNSPVSSTKLTNPSGTNTTEAKVKLSQPKQLAPTPPQETKGIKTRSSGQKDGARGRQSTKITIQSATKN